MLAMSSYATSGIFRHAALNEIFILFEGRLTRGAHSLALRNQFCAMAAIKASREGALFSTSVIMITRSTARLRQRQSMSGRIQQ
jgi:hypothetical protein